MEELLGLFELFDFLLIAGDGGSAISRAARAPSKLTFGEQYQSLRTYLTSAAEKAGLSAPKTTPTPNWLSDFPLESLTPMPKHLAQATLAEAGKQIGQTTASLSSEEFALLSGLSVHHQKGLQDQAQKTFLNDIANTLQPNDPETVKTALQESAKRIEAAAEKARNAGQWKTWAIAGAAVVTLGAVIWIAQKHKAKKAEQKSFSQQVETQRMTYNSMAQQRN